jgi:hypothetical protein
MIVYTAVPTKGLPKDVAADYYKLLTYATTDGQLPGFGNGQLPPGYLPLTKANGLGQLASYTTRAAAAVKAQKGALPSLVGSGPGENKGGPGPSPGQGTGTGPGNGTGTGTGAGSGDGTGTVPPAGSSRTGNPGKGSNPTVAGNEPATSPGITTVASSTVAGTALPALLGLAVLSGLLAPIIVRLRSWRRSS